METAQKINLFIRLFLRLGVLLLPMMFSACAVPVVYGPHYRAVYTDADSVDKLSLSDAARPIMAPLQSPEAVEQSLKSQRSIKREAWTFGPDGTRLKLVRGQCGMLFSAGADDENFLLNWNIDRSEGCALTVVDEPVSVEDLETGQRYEVKEFHRLFGTSPPGLPISETVDLASSIPGFKYIPASERRYTVSLPFRMAYEGKLPEQILLQIPPLWIGDRQIQIPQLVLHGQSEFMGPFTDYEPGVSKEMSKTFAFSEFAGRAIERGLSAAVEPYSFEVKKLWPEPVGEISLATNVSGREDMKKWGDHFSTYIWGYIDIHVRSGAPIRLSDGHVVLRQVPEHGNPVFIPVKQYNLIKYTTAKVDDMLNGRFLKFNMATPYQGAGVPDDGLKRYAERPDEPYVDKNVHLIALIPAYQPKRVRVTLPRIMVGGEIWPIQPIEFEYKESTVELIDAM